MSKKRKLIYTVLFGVIAITLLMLCIVSAYNPDRFVQFHNHIPSYESLLPPIDEPKHIAY